MPRYTTQARVWIEDELLVGEHAHTPDLTVSQRQPVDTGLIDQSGHAIMRMPTPIGYGRDAEW